MNDSIEDFDTGNLSSGHMDDSMACIYYGTYNIEVKVFLILGFGTSIAAVSFVENSFLSYLLTSNARFRTSQLFYLCILSFMDVFLAISYILLMSCMVFFDYTKSLTVYRIWMHYFRPMLALSVITLTTSVYLILAMSFERYLQTLTHHGRKIRAWVENHRWLIALVVVIFATVIRGTKYWEVNVTFRENCSGQFGEYAIAGDVLFGNRDFHQVWTFWVRSTVHVLIPFPLLLYFNAAIMFTMRKHYVSEKRMPYHGKAPVGARRTKSSVKQATVMLICVISMYLFSNVLNFITTIWEFTDQDTLYQVYITFYDYSSDIISILTILSGALRLPIYCVCNQFIRSECIRLLSAITRLSCHKGAKFEELTGRTLVSTFETGTQPMSPVFRMKEEPKSNKDEFTPLTERSRMSAEHLDSIIEINLADSTAGTRIYEYPTSRYEANGVTLV